ncbi:hypothetical protein LX77_02959 [Gelidibacter algens]|uniref:Uncharacterized protein n=1 Tax=Gelidibacter algens TaxID=49280 RepID=A0A327RWY7_9FLAO|nr:hypothetical protein [Gelidibacter algens]RAJ20965.1 hypothetical protein LX77_02959 [Gelidibacter algens]
MKTENLIQRNGSNFDNWDIILNNYINTTFHPQDFSHDVNKKAFFDTNNLLAEISNYFFDYGKFRDKIDYSKCSLNFFGQNLFLKSFKTKSIFRWGLDMRNFYISYDIHNPQSIKSMGDEFWLDFLKLTEFGEFYFQENEVNNSEEKKMFAKYKKSNLFRLMSNYFVHEIQNIEVDDNEKYRSFGLGTFKVKWSIETEWDVLINESSKVFEIFHRLDYKLWKIQDSKNKKKVISLKKNC